MLVEEEQMVERKTEAKQSKYVRIKKSLHFQYDQHPSIVVFQFSQYFHFLTKIFGDFLIARQILFPCGSSKIGPVNYKPRAADILLHIHLQFPIFSVFPVFPIFRVFPVVILFPVVIVRYSTVEGSFEIGEVIARSGHCAANCC